MRIFLILLLATLVLVILVNSAWSINWEIVEVEKKAGQDQGIKEYVLKLKDPYVLENKKDIPINEIQLTEIKKYFNVGTVKEMVGYQFIPDVSQVGIVKSITEIR